MAGPVPAIHVFHCDQDVDARHKAGHDVLKYSDERYFAVNARSASVRASV